MTKTNLKAIKWVGDVKLPVGAYWVGDPCYVYPEWTQFCDVLFKLGNIKNGAKFTYGGDDFIVWSTAHGDGSYELFENTQMIGECGVDAGLLSIIPDSLIELWDSKKKYDGIWHNMGGVSIILQEKYKISIKGGNAKFGCFSIKTG